MDAVEDVYISGPTNPTQEISELLSDSSTPVLLRKALELFTAADPRLARDATDKLDELCERRLAANLRGNAQGADAHAARNARNGDLMTRRAQHVICGVLFAALAGCHANPTPPTEEDAQTAWHHIAAQTTADKLEELVSLKKTDGQMQDVNGMKVYTLFYEAKIRYLTRVGQWKAGDVRVVKSNYGFQRTEKGWQGPDGTIYTK